MFKSECICTTVFHDGPSKTLADLEYATAGWVNSYNNRRLHGSIGMVPAVEYEQAHYAALKPEMHHMKPSPIAAASAVHTTASVAGDPQADTAKATCAAGDAWETEAIRLADGDHHRRRGTRHWRHRGRRESNVDNGQPSSNGNRD